MITSAAEPTVPAEKARDSRKGRGGWVGWLLLAAAALLTGYVVFGHGCHGDEDNELFLSGKAGELRKH
jgi:hypothetical protein